MIDLDKERRWVWELMQRAKIPQKDKVERFQDFAVFFYERYAYDEEHKPTTYIRLVFGNWLAASAKAWKRSTLDQLCTSLSDKREDYVDWIQEQGLIQNPEEEIEDTLYCSEVFAKFKPVTQEYILDRSVCQRLAKEEGVTRQAIENRVKRDMKEVLDKLGE